MLLRRDPGESRALTVCGVEGREGEEDGDAPASGALSLVEDMVDEGENEG